MHWRTHGKVIRVDYEDLEDWTIDADWVAAQRSQAAKRMYKIEKNIFPNLSLWNAMRKCFDIEEFPTDPGHLKNYGRYLQNCFPNF